MDELDRLYERLRRVDWEWLAERIDYPIEWARTGWTLEEFHEESERRWKIEKENRFKKKSV